MQFKKNPGLSKFNVWLFLALKLRTFFCTSVFDLNRFLTAENKISFAHLNRLLQSNVWITACVLPKIEMPSTTNITLGLNFCMAIFYKKWQLWSYPQAGNDLVSKGTNYTCNDFVDFIFFGFVRLFSVVSISKL